MRLIDRRWSASVILLGKLKGEKGLVRIWGHIANPLEELGTLFILPLRVRVVNSTLVLLVVSVRIRHLVKYWLRS